jgi:hypothetical protein
MVKVLRKHVGSMTSMLKGPTRGERKRRIKEGERVDSRLIRFSDAPFLSSYTDQGCTRQSYGGAAVCQLSNGALTDFGSQIGLRTILYFRSSRDIRVRIMSPDQGLERWLTDPGTLPEISSTRT